MSEMRAILPKPWNPGDCPTLNLWTGRERGSMYQYPAHVYTSTVAHEASDSSYLAAGASA